MMLSTTCDRDEAANRLLATVDTWHATSACGDFTIRSAGDDDATGTSVIECHDLTDGERTQLERLLATARERGWVTRFGGKLPKAGKARNVNVKAPLLEVAQAFTEILHGKDAITAVRSTNGEIALVRVGQSLVKASEPESEAAPPAAPTGPSKGSTAVTVKKPTLCCPEPQPGPMERASAVLRTFCTRRQWSTWLEHGWLEVTGHLSGHRYRLHHRHHPDARRLGYITYDLTDERVLHGYLWSVPPPEEVLSFKLFLENAEPYVRNAASGFSRWFKGLGLDPRVYGGWAFGTGDTAFMNGLATGLGVPQ